ncbi:GNAT family N-acetyltransferase [Nocardia sp. CDC159]|uniref:GNAT family N-acetyltransferase n=1 Tax=Nocardia pulmonis TaxID=2951408 RepID=A0A9X2IUM5_9NOCA|nr:MULTISPECIES: GNAT family N-acetyltransferase [Nocardia]MCM6773017.1 GNAT family N-acetyltransferase [Nocardia pulmonis]MCM6785680.1 GNAT family N-acetyltransferase [Nocardia sp. CDC159]
MADCVLTDGTVWLSRPAEAEIDTIVDCCREPSIGEWTTIPVPYEREHAEKFLADVVAPGWYGGAPTWAIRESADAPLVGMIGLMRRDLGDVAAAEIGFWLASRGRGKGLMTRAAALVCDFGFAPEHLSLTRIEWRAFVGNHASAAVARRVGFRYEGLLRLGGDQRGVRRDSWIAARLADDPAGPAPGWPPGI